MRPEFCLTQAPTFQLDTNAYDMLHTSARTYAGVSYFSQLNQYQGLAALDAMIPVFFNKELEPDQMFGFTRILAEGSNGYEKGIRPPGLEWTTLSAAISTGKFVVELVRKQSLSDKINKLRRIQASFVFGDPFAATPRLPVPANYASEIVF